jgi:hypothetical protein
LQPEVADWSIDKKIGDKIGKINSSWDRAGYFIVTADDYQRVEEISQNILNSIKFIVE